MADNSDPKIVNDWFWLAHAAKLVGDASDRIDQGALRVASAMGWFWTTYSGALTASVAIGNRVLDQQTAILVTAPVVPLFVAYASAIWASSPIPLAFNCVAPLEVKEAHESAIQKKRNRLTFSVAAAAVSTALVIVAVAAIVQLPPRGSEVFNVELVQRSKRYLVVSGVIPSVQDAVLLVKQDEFELPPVHAALREGALSRTIEVKPADNYQVELTWMASGRRYSITHDLKKDPR